MPHAAISPLSHYLRRLTACCGEPATDHELLQQFVTDRDEYAFAALVKRYAAMVLGLCRSILRNHHDAEDIFQAVFLVLARKAASIRKRESVGSWLYAIAYRLAHKERIRAGKRRLHEQQAVASSGQTPMDEVTWGELRDLVHEEVNRLPEKYRAAVVLCYWQGRTHEQAGQQLGCARATIKDRLEKARELLKKRLARRGLALSAAWFAASLAEGTAAVVPVELLQTTVRGAFLFSLGELPAGIVSTPASDCAAEILKEMLMSKCKYGLALMLIFGMIGSGAGLAMLRETPVPETEPEASATAAAPKELPLPAGAIARLGTLRFRHSDRVRCIALGADGDSVVSAAGKFIHVWDLATGKERRRFVGHEEEVNAVACSRDGKRIASLSADGKIHLWDAASGKELRRFAAHPPNHNPVWRSWQMPGLPALAFTPDGRQLVSRGSDNSVRLWDAATGERKRDFNTISLLKLERSSALGFALSPDGKHLAVLEGKINSPSLQMWDVTQGRIIPGPASKGCVWGMTFSPNGKTLAVGIGAAERGPGNLELWDVASAKKIRSFPLPEGEKPLTFAPDGKTLITTWWNGARIRDVQTGAILSRLGVDHSSLPFNQLLFGGDGKTLVSYTHGENVLRLWDRSSGKEMLSPGQAVSPVRCVFSPNGRYLAVGAENGVLSLWDASSHHEVWRENERPLLSGILFAPDSRLLVTNIPLETSFRLRDVSSGKEVRQIDKKRAHLTSLAWSGDGKWLATWPLQGAGNECFVQLWDAATGREVRRLSAGVSPINALAFSPDSKLLLAARNELAEGGIRCWAVTGGRLAAFEGPVPGGLKCLAFSPDGRTVAAAAMDRNIYLWETITGRKRSALKVDEVITSLAFSPDGKVLAAAGNSSYNHNFLTDDGTHPEQGKSPPPCVHLWDVVAEQELPSLAGHRGSITSLSFAPDGKLLATGSNDTTVLLWDATRFGTRHPKEGQPRPDQLEAWWADLADADAVKAYRAIRTLAAAPQASVTFLNKQLHPITSADPKQVARLLIDLDSEQFAVRDKAMQQLEKLGESTATDLHKALAGKPTLEVKRRIEQLLEKQFGAEHIRTVRALETLERIGTAEARELCAALADGVADAPLTREARATLRRMKR